MLEMMLEKKCQCKTHYFPNFTLFKRKVGPLNSFVFESCSLFTNRPLYLAILLDLHASFKEGKMMMQVSLPKKDKNKTKKEANKESQQFHRVPMTYAL